MSLHDACTSGTSRVLTVVEFGYSYSSTRRLWSAVCGKVFEWTKRRSKFIVSCYKSSATYCSTFNTFPAVVRAQSFSSFLAPKEFPVRSGSASSEWQWDGDECHSDSNPRRQTSVTQETKVCPTVWETEVNMMKNMLWTHYVIWRHRKKSMNLMTVVLLLIKSLQ